MYIIVNVYYTILYYSQKKPYGRTLTLQKTNTEKLAKTQSSSCLLRHSAACLCIHILTPSPITQPLTLFPKEILPDLAHFLPPLPRKVQHILLFTVLAGQPCCEGRIHFLGGECGVADPHSNGALRPCTFFHSASVSILRHSAWSQSLWQALCCLPQLLTP